MYDVLYKTTVLAILLLYAGTADAHGSLRCKGRIVDVGDSAAKVLALCGNPSGRTVTRVPVRAAVGTGFTRFAGFSISEQWVYDRGYGKFPAVLYLYEGRIRRIDYLPHRSGDY
jgi:hypothetical protein